MARLLEFRAAAPSRALTIAQTKKNPLPDLGVHRCKVAQMRKPDEGQERASQSEKRGSCDDYDNSSRLEKVVLVDWH